MKSLAALLSLLLFAITPLARADQAADTTVAITGQAAGATPFIAKLTLDVSDLASLTRIRFTIQPKAGSVTRPISVLYSQDYLASRGYVDSGAGKITVPVFGLYADFVNTVRLTYTFADGSLKRASTTVATAPFDDNCHYGSPTVHQARTATRQLSYDYIFVSTNCSENSPAVIDTDGALRWVGTSGFRHYTSTFNFGAVYLANLGVVRIDLDGEVTRITDLENLGAVDLHHSINKGKYGLILDINTTDWVESVNVEIDRAGHVLHRWVLGDIIRQAMIDGGDDPTPFVRNANGRYDFHAFEDWFHNNACWYRKSDDSLIVSSRENFVICLDYESGKIKWILGDPTKQWYQYPSLRKYALALTPGSHAPIGQHAVSITHDDNLLLFDNGQRSQNHAPYGASRSYSAAREYKLDLVNRTATEVWNFTNNQSIRSPFQSSVFEDAPDNYVIHYAKVPTPRIVGLAPSGEKVFDYSFPGYAFRSLPVHWENLAFLAPVSSPTQSSDAEAFSVDEE